jgi:DNA-binding Lrp family transcriptional regulator
MFIHTLPEVGVNRALLAVANAIEDLQREGTSQPTLQQISERAQYSERHVRRALRLLERSGQIKRNTVLTKRIYYELVN